jgi:hypothetical protein
MTYLVRLTLLRSSRSQFAINRTINPQNYSKTLHYRKMLAHTGLDRYGVTKMAELVFKSFNAQYFSFCSFLSFQESQPN